MGLKPIVHSYPPEDPKPSIHDKPRVNDFLIGHLLNLIDHAGDLGFQGIDCDIRDLTVAELDTLTHLDKFN